MADFGSPSDSETNQIKKQGEETIDKYPLFNAGLNRTVILSQIVHYNADFHCYRECEMCDKVFM